MSSCGFKSGQQSLNIKMLEIPPIRVNNQLDTFRLVLLQAAMQLLVKRPSVGICEVADLSEKVVFIGVDEAWNLCVSQNPFWRSVKRYDIA